MDAVTLGLAQASAKKRYSRKTFAAPARRLAITNNLFGTADFTVRTAPGTSRNPHIVGVNATGLQVMVGNFYNDSTADLDPANPLPIRAALEIGGVVYPLFFGGKRDITIDPGGVATSDPLPIMVTAGDLIYSRIYTSSTTYYANRNSLLTAAQGGFTATIDLTGTGAAAIPDSTGWWIAPMAITGITDGSSAAVLLVGDSIANGFGDNGTYSGQAPLDMTRAGGGFLTRGLTGHAGIMNIGVSGDKIGFFIPTTGHKRRMQFAQHCTHAVVEYGRNDITALVDYLTVGTNVLTAGRMCKRYSLKTVVTTVTPRCTSTDNFMTVGNQTQSPAGAEAIRVQYNTWLRAGAPMNPATFAAVAIGTAGAVTIGQAGHPYDVLWEVTDLLESGRNTGYWAAANKTVTVATSSTTNTGVMVATAGTFAASDVGRSVVVVGANTSGTNLATSITAVAADGSTATLNSNAKVTLASTTMAIGIMSQDGTHPYPGGAVVASAAVNLADIASQ